VPVVQLVALLVIATAGAGHPRIVMGIYIPLIVVAAVLSTLYMDNITSVRNDTGAFRESVREGHTWIMAFLSIGTFGSFIGYSFAFGLVLQNEFGRTPLQAAAVTFVGPLLGSLIRPVGGKLADRFGGARVTFVNFVAMVVASAVILAGSAVRSLPIYVAGFVVLLVLTSIGNGSTYKMIPAIFRGLRALAAIGRGGDETAQLMRARRISGAAIGIIGAVGALGGLFINLAFRQSFLTAKTGDPVFWAFIAFYLVCIAVTYAVYLRPVPVDVSHPRAAYARV
jgi:MFS transporter, NNP family, nitrate/nitrite transporter